MEKLYETIRQLRSGPQYIMYGTSKLTRAQAITLILVAAGLPKKNIADFLEVSIKTIDKHCQACHDAFSVSSNVGLTHCAIKYGLINAGDYFGH
jgi:DNA-binding NarL/FixJ family response regulator